MSLLWVFFVKSSLVRLDGSTVGIWLWCNSNLARWSRILMLSQNDLLFLQLCSIHQISHRALSHLFSRIEQASLGLCIDSPRHRKLIVIRKGIKLIIGVIDGAQVTSVSCPWRRPPLILNPSRHANGLRRLRSNVYTIQIPIVVARLFILLDFLLEQLMLALRTLPSQTRSRTAVRWAAIFLFYEEAICPW